MSVAKFVAVVDSCIVAANAPTAICVLASDYEALERNYESAINCLCPKCQLRQDDTHEKGEF